MSKKGWRRGSHDWGKHKVGCTPEFPLDPLMRFVNHQETVITLDFTYFLSVSKITSTLFNFFFLFQLINARKSLSIFNPITTKSHHLLSRLCWESTRQELLWRQPGVPVVAARAAHAALTGVLAIGAHVQKDEGDGWLSVYSLPGSFQVEMQI